MASSTTVNVFQSNQIEPDTLLMPYRIKEKLRIKSTFITVNVGLQLRQIHLVFTRKTSKLGLHPQLALDLFISEAIAHSSLLHVNFDKRSDSLTLGPVIAVLINPINEEQQSLFGNITTYAEELSLVAKQKGLLLYFLTADELPTHTTGAGEQYVNGWIRHQNWIKARLPFPIVVYNRVASLQIEQSDPVQYFFTQLTKLNIPYFNSRFFNKDEVFNALQLESSVKSYLPYSVPLTNISQISNLLKNYNTLYIKPIHGRLGKGILRIQTIHSTNKYKLEEASRSAIKGKYYTTVDQLLQHIRGKLKQESYQLQEGINLIKVDQKPVDFRVLVQKNGVGQWTVTSIVARIAAADIFVSNIAKGGTITSLSQLLPLTSLNTIYTTETLSSKLKYVALNIAKAFEKYSDTIVGELGIDLGIDDKGHPWLLEINCKPSKLTNAKLEAVKVRPSVRMLISYSLFLSGFKQGVKVK